MRLQPLYQATFTTPEAWSVQIAGSAGGERQSFLIAEGRTEGKIVARFRGSNYPRKRVDDTTLPDFRGVLETDDGATVLFSWQGFARGGSGEAHELVRSAVHVSDDERYRRLNDVICVLAGEVRRRADGHGSDVVFDVVEVVWEPPTASATTQA